MAQIVEWVQYKTWDGSLWEASLDSVKKGFTWGVGNPDFIHRPKGATTPHHNDWKALFWSDIGEQWVVECKGRRDGQFANFEFEFRRSANQGVDHKGDIWMFRDWNDNVCKVRVVGTKLRDLSDPLGADAYKPKFEIL
ncbi:MAG: hypothetical protein U1A78_23425 [Polyangia bacterium]